MCVFQNLLGQLTTQGTKIFIIGKAARFFTGVFGINGNETKC